MTTQLTITDGWASPAELRQASLDLRAAVDLIDRQGWTKHISDGGQDGKPVCASRALGLVTGVDDNWKSFASRTNLALSAVYRVTKMLLTQINDKASDWATVRNIMLGVATDCELAANRGDLRAATD